MAKKTKICFISSSGGHFSELSRLKELTNDYDSFLVVERPKGFKTSFCKKQYFVKEINRKEFFFLFHFIFLFIKEFFIFLREKPSVVITTGALASYPMIKIAHFFKKKTVYIESFARVYDLSLTGKKVYKTVDLFLVQWEDLLPKYPKACYYGSLFDSYL